MTDSPRITGASWVMVAALGVTWGGTFMVTEIALRGITPFWLASGRICFAAVLTATIWQAMGGRLFAVRPDLTTWASVLAIGGFSTAIPFILLAWGQQYVTSGFAGVSMASVALIVLPLSHLLLPDERMTWRRTLGFVIGFFGVCVLIGGRTFEPSGASQETAGRIACVAAACCYGVSSVLMRRLPAVDAMGLSTVLLLIASVMTFSAAVIVEGVPPVPDANTLLVIAGLGLVPTAAANLLRVVVIRSAGPVFMSITNYQVPVWSVVLGAMILGEPLPPSLLLALFLILIGVGLSQYGAFQRLFSREA